MLAKKNARWPQVAPGPSQGKGRHYWKSLILILLIASIPGLITGVLMYSVVGGRIEGEMVQLHNKQIAKRAENLEAQFAHMELTMSHLAFEPLFDLRLKETDFFYHFEVTRDITKTLMVMEGAMPLATKLEFYLDRETPIQFGPNFNMMPRASEDWKRIEGLIHAGPSVYWTKLPSTATAKRDQQDLSLVYKMPGGVTEPYGLLVARIDTQRVQDNLKALTPYEEGEAFLLQEDGSLLASTGSGATPQLLQTLMLEKQRHTSDSSSFIMKIQDQKYFISFGKFERIGTTWSYISAAPINAIIQPVVFFSKRIIQFSAAGLVLAAILAWLASRKIYSPMARLLGLLSPSHSAPAQQGTRKQDEFQLIEEQWRQLARESQALQSKLEHQLPQVRQGFLYQLVQGHLTSYSEAELKERMGQYGWKGGDCRYQVMFIRLLGMSQACESGRFAMSDEGLVSFAAANIAQEMVEERYGFCQIINLHDLTVGILIEIQPDACKGKTGLYELGESLIQALNRILHMRVTVAVGGSCTAMKQIPWVFEEARHALHYRRWDADHQMLDVELLRDREKATTTLYPFGSEREIVQAMRTGKLEEAERQLQAFLEDLRQDGATDLDVRQGVMNLLGTLEHEILQSGLNPNELLAPINRFEQLSALREPERIRDWFVVQIIRPFMDEMEKRSNYKIKKIVEQAIQYIEAHYKRDISLDECAEYCGANPFLLSRSFKQVSGKNFIDYLTDLRMDKAKDRLRNSDDRINDIAEDVGYQHSYFNRLFKKFEGVTPTQFRERARRV